MTKKPAHKPAGIPEGGQFAATSHAEPGVSLTGEPRFDADAHAELNTAIRAETARVEEAKQKLSRMHLDAAVAIVRKDFPDAAGLELDFTSSTGMNARAVRDRDGNVLSEGTSWIYSSPGDGSYLCSHLDAVQQSLFYNGQEGFRYEDETGALVVDLDHRFSKPAPQAPPSWAGSPPPRSRTTWRGSSTIASAAAICRTGSAAPRPTGNTGATGWACPT